MDDLTEAQEDFVARWFFGSPLIVLAFLVLSVVLTRQRGERQWLRIFLGLDTAFSMVTMIAALVAGLLLGNSVVPARQGM